MAGYDAIIVGGGVVGAAIGCSLAARRMRVAIADGSDRDPRSSRGNFGLIWGQGKGQAFPAYRDLTRLSLALWRDYASEIAEASGMDLGLRLGGGLTFCLGEADYAKASRSVDDQTSLLNRVDLQRHVGVDLGPDVTGALLGHRDGDVDPIRFFKALHLAFLHRGGTFLPGGSVRGLARHGSGTAVMTSGPTHVADRVVIAAGLATEWLAAVAGIHAPVRAQRGQLLVTERTGSILPLPASGLKQTPDGTVMIGLTTEEVGPDRSVTTEAARKMASRATRIIPALAGLTVIRHWACLRVMTPDASPIYAISDTMPGVFVAACHSGITLAPIHGGLVAEAVLTGGLCEDLAPFGPERFKLPEAA